MKNITPRSLSLNQTDFLWLTMNDVFASMMGQVVILYFATRHSPEEIKSAMRRIVSLFPRLRLYVKPHLFSHRIHFYKDDAPVTEQFFNNAFRVIPNVRYGTPEFHAYRKKLLNERFSLASGFAFTMNYFPDSEEPMLLMPVHHLICDGVGWYHMVDALMAILNGKDPKPVPVDNPSLKSVFLEKPWYRVPRQIVRSYRIYRQGLEERKNDIPYVLLTSERSRYFQQCDMEDRRWKYPASLLKKRSKELGFTVTSLFIAALALALKKESTNKSANAAHIYFPIDLRPFYEEGRRPVHGNYLTIGLIRLEGTTLEDVPSLIPEIKAQMDRNLELIKSKNMLYPFLLNKGTTLMGVRLFRRLARSMKKSSNYVQDFMFSTLGNTSGLNSHGPGAQLMEATASVPEIGIFFGASSMNERVYSTLSYPLNEYSKDKINAFLDAFEESIGEIISIK